MLSIYLRPLLVQADMVSGGFFPSLVIFLIFFFKKKSFLVCLLSNRTCSKTLDRRKLPSLDVFRVKTRSIFHGSILFRDPRITVTFQWQSVPMSSKVFYRSGPEPTEPGSYIVADVELHVCGNLNDPYLFDLFVVYNTQIAQCMFAYSAAARTPPSELPFDSIRDWLPRRR